MTPSFRWRSDRNATQRGYAEVAHGTLRGTPHGEQGFLYQWLATVGRGHLAGRGHRKGTAAKEKWRIIPVGSPGGPKRRIRRESLGQPRNRCPIVRLQRRCEGPRRDEH